MSADWEQWSRVRERSRDWLERWEPLRPVGTLDPVRDQGAFTSRCAARERERQLGTGYAFGLFLHDGSFLGEININNVLRSAFMSAHVGYWVDERHAGKGYVPEGLVRVLQFAFEDAKLHRLQISIIPRNRSSRRVVEKLALREEGIAQRYLLINGVWEDHVRYAITSEEWDDRGASLVEAFVG
jgi:ribosomal-protein-alanine N-acetyltransferase